jgi:hypothetical protein
VVNASTETRSKAAALMRQGIPAVCVVPPDAPAVFWHGGRAVRGLPRQPQRPQGAVHQLRRSLWPARSAQAERGFVITFPAHGARASAAAAHCS